MRDTLVAPPVRLPKPNEPCWCGSGQKYKRCHQRTDASQARTAQERREARRVRPGRISPIRPVPLHIPRPDYALSGTPAPPASSCVLRTPDQLERMRRACRAAAHVLQHTSRAVRPGITTDELDAIAHDEIIRLGGYPSPLNYRGFPKSICTSVNEVICHGIPDSRPLQEGDIVNLDITIFLDGMHGDCSATYAVGEVDESSKRLMRVTRECLDIGIAAARPGRPISDIGRAIEAHARAHGYGVVRAYCGHGIGEQFHTELQVPHYYEASATTKMMPGMTFTIEPMITVGTWDYRIWPDDWTAVTADLERTAQYEHTILVTESGAEILTRLE
jgi:methionyl aminopeptidase